MILQDFKCLMKVMVPDNMLFMVGLNGTNPEDWLLGIIFIELLSFQKIYKTIVVVDQVQELWLSSGNPIESFYIILPINTMEETMQMFISTIILRKLNNGSGSIKELILTLKKLHYLLNLLQITISSTLSWTTHTLYLDNLIFLWVEINIIKDGMEK